MVQVLLAKKTEETIAVVRSGKNKRPDSSMACLLINKTSHSPDVTKVILDVSADQGDVIAKVRRRLKCNSEIANRLYGWKDFSLIVSLTSFMRSDDR